MLQRGIPKACNMKLETDYVKKARARLLDSLVETKQLGYPQLSSLVLELAKLNWQTEPRQVFKELFG